MTFLLSEIDRARFGVVTAKATADGAADLDQIFSGCKASDVELLILRVDSNALVVVQGAEQRGALMMDSLVYFEKSVDPEVVLTLPPSVTLRTGSPPDAPRIASLAAEIFKDYNSHYHADARLPKERSDEVYSSWAENACLNPKVADAMLMLERGGKILGFAALKLTGPDRFDCCLVGVSSLTRREGVFRLLLTASEQWGKSRGLKVMEYSTQITNVAAQRGLCKAGFLPVKSCYTLHKWFV